MHIVTYNDTHYVSTNDAKKFLGITIHDLYNTINYHKSLDTVKIGHGRFIEVKSLRKAKRTGNYTGAKQ